MGDVHEEPTADPGEVARTVAYRPPAADDAPAPPDPAARTMTGAPVETPSTAPKVSDFGLAKKLDAEDDLSRTGQVLGTPGYMPPEQAA